MCGNKNRFSKYGISGFRTEPFLLDYRWSVYEYKYSFKARDDLGGLVVDIILLQVPYAPLLRWKKKYDPEENSQEDCLRFS